MIDAGDLQSHWRRIWLRAPGFEDGDTQVHWMQCGLLYADLRVPADLPALTGASALSDLPPEALLVLMQAEGFAGTIDVQDSICTWARDINWHGTPDGVDAGRMSFDENGDLIEDGVHAKYAELWRKMPDPPVTALRVNGGGIQGVLVLCEGQFLLGIGHPDAAPSAPLVMALEAGEVPVGLAAHFASHYVMGAWDGTVGTASLATNPFLQGQPVLTRTQAGFRFDAVGFDGTPTQIDLTT